MLKIVNTSCSRSSSGQVLRDRNSILNHNHSILDPEHCWLSDDQCNGGMKWTQWAYRWKSRITLGYYPRGQILQNTYLDRSNTNDDWTELKSNAKSDIINTMNAQELDKNT